MIEYTECVRKHHWNQPLHVVSSKDGIFTIDYVSTYYTFTSHNKIQPVNISNEIINKVTITYNNPSKK